MGKGLWYLRPWGGRVHATWVLAERGQEPSRGTGELARCRIAWRPTGRRSHTFRCGGPAAEQAHPTNMSLKHRRPAFTPRDANAYPCTNTASECPCKVWFDQAGLGTSHPRLLHTMLPLMIDDNHCDSQKLPTVFVSQASWYSTRYVVLRPGCGCGASYQRLPGLGRYE